MERKSTPEYETLKKFLPDICDSLCGAPVSISPLAEDLRAAGIVHFHVAKAAAHLGTLTFTRANDLMTAAMAATKLDPGKFETLLEKLENNGLKKIVEKMEKHCDTLGRSKMGSARDPEEICRKETLGAAGIKSIQEGKEIKEGMKILVVGHNGSGKSSLINDLMGQSIALVGQLHTQTKHPLIQEYQCFVAGKKVTIYDTRGFGDPEVRNEDTVEAIGIMKTVDVILICHKLFDKVDKHTIEELEALTRRMGDDLIDLSILVFTFGDDYLARCSTTPKYTDDNKLTTVSKEKLRKEMETQQKELEKIFKEALQRCGIRKDVVDKIPTCITCGKSLEDGTKKELPTSDNWIVELWDLCVDRCKPDSREFVSSFRIAVLKELWHFAGGFLGSSTSSFIRAVGAALKGYTEYRIDTLQS